MAQVNFDWKVLRGALSIFGVCLLGSAVLIGVSQYFRDQMRAEFRDHQARFRGVSQQYLAIDEEERIIQEHLPEFVRLFESGVVGDEHRLDWLEALREAGAVIKLPNLAYNIDSQALHRTDFPLELGAYDLFASRMTLDIGLLHEGDLLQLFDILNDEAAGLYNVSRCTLSREGTLLDLNSARSNLSANCEILWYTLELRGGEEIKL